MEFTDQEDRKKKDCLSPAICRDEGNQRTSEEMIERARAKCCA
jgi:hypothetical protein